MHIYIYIYKFFSVTFDLFILSLGALGLPVNLRPVDGDLHKHPQLLFQICLKFSLRRCICAFSNFSRTKCTTISKRLFFCLVDFYDYVYEFEICVPNEVNHQALHEKPNNSINNSQPFTARLQRSRVVILNCPFNTEYILNTEM